jgi:hypothetical protein
MTQHVRAVFLAGLVFCSSSSAEPVRNDPNGWDVIQFDMTFEQVVAALGPRAKKRKNPLAHDPTARPLMWGGQVPIDVMEMQALADRLIELNRTAPDEVPVDVLKACKRLTQLSKPQKWATRRGQGIATLATVGPGLGVRFIARNGEKTDLDRHDLPPATMTRITELIDAANVARTFSRNRDVREHDAGDLFKIQGPDDLVIDDVVLGGVSFTPEVGFTPNVSGVSLTHLDSLQGPTDPVAVYDKITAQMEKDFGKPAEAKLDAEGRIKKWSLPQTDILVQYRARTYQSMVHLRGQDQIVEQISRVVHVVYTMPAVLPAQEPPVQPAAPANLVGPSKRLGINDQITANLGRYAAKLLPDGDFVVIRIFDNKRLWSSGTAGRGAVGLVVQEDGDTQLLTEDGTVIWSAGTAGNPGACLFVQDDGNLCIYTDIKATRSLWAAGCVD